MRSQERDEAGVVPAAVYLEKAMQKRGCPICRRVRETEERWIWNVLYELTGDAEIHKRFAASLGLCREHAALMAQVVETRELVTPTGVARLYETVAVHAVEEVERIRGREPLSRKNCPLCEIAQEAADREAWSLGRLLVDPEFWRVYESSDGLCLPHFSLVSQRTPAQIRTKLGKDFRRRLARLLQNLRELQRKERFDVNESLTPEEIQSWREALWRLAGMTYSEPLIKRG